MFTQKDFLEFAFQEAVGNVNIASLKETEIIDVIKTGMKSYAAKNNQTFTMEEIEKKIAEGLKEMNIAGKDFSFMNWIMK